jgi:hypothetical protein
MADEEDRFSADVSAWCDRAGEQARQVFLAIGFDALTRVKELTPVRTGNLRAGWQLVRRQDALPVDRDLTIGAAGAAGGLAGSWAGAAAGAAAGSAAGPLGGALGGIAGGIAGGILGEAGASAAASAATAPGDVANTELGDTLVILNPVVYAWRVETGWTIQRKDGGITTIEGRGMVAQTVAEMPRIADAALARIVRGGA